MNVAQETYEHFKAQIEGRKTIPGHAFFVFTSSTDVFYADISAQSQTAMGKILDAISFHLNRAEINAVAYLMIYEAFELSDEHVLGEGTADEIESKAKEGNEKEILQIYLKYRAHEKRLVSSFTKGPDESYVLESETCNSEASMSPIFNLETRRSTLTLSQANALVSLKKLEKR